MTAAEKTPKLTKRQTELLERVCLKRYRVVLAHYMGSFRPNESVYVEPVDVDGKLVTAPIDYSFRPSTAESLRRNGLVRFTPDGQGYSVLKPTRAGLDAYRATRS